MDVLEGVDTEVIISHLEACGYEVETKESGVSDDIKDLELKIHELRNKQEEAYEVLKDLKAIHYMAVEDEAKDLGLTNQKKRDIELEGRLRADETYTRIEGETKTRAQQITLLEIDLVFEQRQFKRWYVDGLREAAEASK